MFVARSRLRLEFDFSPQCSCAKANRLPDLQALTGLQAEAVPLQASTLAPLPASSPALLALASILRLPSCRSVLQFLTEGAAAGSGARYESTPSLSSEVKRVRPRCKSAQIFDRREASPLGS